MEAYRLKAQQLWLASSLSLGLCLVLANEASAQYQLSIVEAEASHSLECAETVERCLENGCESGDSVCTDYTYTTGGTEERVCALSTGAISDAVCCDANTNTGCPTYDGKRSKCLPVDGQPTDVCVAPRIYDQCFRDGRALDSDQLVSCLTTGYDRDGSPITTSDWRKGDCDKDGVPNGRDCGICDSENTLDTAHGCKEEPDETDSTTTASTTTAEPPGDLLPAGDDTARFTPSDERSSLKGGGGLSCSTGSDEPLNVSVVALVAIALLTTRSRRLSG